MHKTLSGRLRELKRKTKETSSWVEVAYESFSLQSLCHSLNGVSQRWS